jgi:hypothetical protein
MPVSTRSFASLTGMHFFNAKNRSRRKRQVLLYTYTALVLLTAAGILGWAVNVWSSARPAPTDRLAEVGDILALGTLALAAIAGFVALQAYASATGLPDLQLQIRFPFSENNQPAFRAEVPDDGTMLTSVPFKQTSSTIILWNTSVYSARNPALVVRLNNMAYVPGEYDSNVDNGWTTLEFVTTFGATALQWDGGPTYSIHGKSKRYIALDLTRLTSVPRPADSEKWLSLSLDFELLAEGYRRQITVPVNFTLDGQPQVPFRPMPEWL